MSLFELILSQHNGATVPSCICYMSNITPRTLLHGSCFVYPAISTSQLINIYRLMALQSRFVSKGDGALRSEHLPDRSSLGCGRLSIQIPAYKVSAKDMYTWVEACRPGDPHGPVGLVWVQF